MQVVFDDDGVFKAGLIMSDSGTALQVELSGGRRIKVKAANVALRFNEPPAAQVVQEAEQLGKEIDLAFLWECAPPEEFGFEVLGSEYFGANPSPAQTLALLSKLHSSPVYFQKKGKGRYKRAPADQLKAALAGIEKKQQIQQQIQQWIDSLTGANDQPQGLPKEIAAAANMLAFVPDKMRPEFKALEAACLQLQTTPRKLLLQLGAFANEKSLHDAGFLLAQFPGGIGFSKDLDFKERKTGALANAFAEKFAALAKPSNTASASGAGSSAADVIGPLVYALLPFAKVQAFSIDDSSTTEIDDCLSVTQTEQGWRVGVHIAAPGMAIKPRDPLDKAARARMSTVYMPGEKITMLPENVVSVFSLDEGREVPVLSLYTDVNADASSILASESRVERLVIAANLRHDKLEEAVSEANLALEQSPATHPELGPHWQSIRLLWRFAQTLTAQRELIRGKPEGRNRADYNFYVDQDQVRIVERMRDAPLDRIVAELMILANSQWGKLLADKKVPGIYRSQAFGRVKMSIHPQVHQSLGVQQYGWFTSPLRRYSDLVNQRQVIAVLRDDKPPYMGSDADLFAVISQFDAKYATYADHQKNMERYWCLRWLGQQGERMQRMEALVVKEDLVRLKEIPLYFRVVGLPEGLLPGRQLWVQCLRYDLMDLSIEARLLEVGVQLLAAEEEASAEIEAPEPAAPEPVALDPVAPGVEVAS